MEPAPPTVPKSPDRVSSVYILLVAAASEPMGISFITRCLIEGFIALNVPFNLSQIPSQHSGHVDLELKFEDYVSPDLTIAAADLVLVDVSDINRYYDQLLDVSQIFPTWNLDLSKTYFITNADNSLQLVATGAEKIIAVHQSTIFPSIGTRYPWGFGISDYQIAIAQQAGLDEVPFTDRWDTVLRNFRPAFSQSVRAALDLALVPLLEQHWTIDSDIYSEDGNNHYERLAGYKFCLGYCGDFRQRVTDYHYFQELWANDPLLIDFHARAKAMSYITRWDSWRFWESLLFGCVTISLDCDRYGYALPVKPVNWQHYIGLELDQIPAAVERMFDEPQTLANIAVQGRQWVLDHYSPKACAERFLALHQ